MRGVEENRDSNKWDARGENNGVLSGRRVRVVYGDATQRINNTHGTV